MKNLIYAFLLLCTTMYIVSCKSPSRTENVTTSEWIQSKENYSDSIFNAFVSILSLKPLKVCDPCSDQPNQRGKAIQIGSYDNIPTITAEGSNRSGGLGGPSLIEIFARKEDKKIIFSSNNTTGSPYTGYEQWQDSYPIDLNDVFTYQDEDKFGIGTSKNTKSSSGTTDYTTNVHFNKKKKSIVFIVFDGSENNTWEQSAQFHFKDTTAAKALISKLVAYAEKYKSSN